MIQNTAKVILETLEKTGGNPSYLTLVTADDTVPVGEWRLITTEVKGSPFLSTVVPLGKFTTSRRLAIGIQPSTGQFAPPPHLELTEDPNEVTRSYYCSVLPPDQRAAISKRVYPQIPQITRALLD